MLLIKLVLPIAEGPATMILSRGMRLPFSVKGLRAGMDMLGMTN